MSKETYEIRYVNNEYQIAKIKTYEDSPCREEEVRSFTDVKDFINDVNQQLKEKDEELALLSEYENSSKMCIEYWQKESKEFENKLKSNTHQLCEKIREEMQYGLSMEDEKGDKWLLESKILLILDQVEKGEIGGRI